MMQKGSPIETSRKHGRLTIILSTYDDLKVFKTAAHQSHRQKLFMPVSSVDSSTYAVHASCNHFLSIKCLIHEQRFHEA